MKLVKEWSERVFDAFWISLAWAVIAHMLSLTTARAADLPDTRTMMARVERILVDQGYSAEGYASLEPPAVYFAPWRLPRGDWGWSVPGTVLLSPEQPEACLRITLAHELAHDAARRMHLLRAPMTAPAWEVRAEMEVIAAIVEQVVERDSTYAPNCLRTWRVSL